MRLHSLDLQAFGPFASRHSIDFDALTTDGLFLLHGDTGAGKSTLFAAICFALYGYPPRERNARLRSDHAPADLLTEVILETTIAGKRLQIRRVPAQRKPHSRRPGEFVDHKPETDLKQWTEDEQGQGRWEGITSSQKEAGKEIESLLGLNRQQFCQVVLLPQNDFTKFLQADASERRVLLGTLFGTRRFGLIEQFLAERKTTTAKSRDEARADVMRLTERIQQAAGDELDPSTGAPRPDDPATLTDQARLWAAALHRQAVTLQQDATAGTDTARQLLADCRTTEQHTRDLHRLQQAHHTAQQELTQLDERTDHYTQLADRHERARTARQLQTVLDDAHTAAREHSLALTADANARALLSAEHASQDGNDLAQAAQQVRSRIGAAQALLPDEAALQQLTDELSVLSKERNELAETVTEAQDWLNGLPQLRETLTARLQAARTAQEASRELTVTLSAVNTQCEAAARRDSLLTQVAAADEALTKATGILNQAAAAYIDIRRRRTDGIVAELAGRLKDGESCPVCGSATHPAPATPQPGQPTAADEQAAEAAHTAAQQEEKKAGQRLGGLEQEAAEARGQAGGDTPLADLTARRTELTDRLRQTLAEAADAGAAEEELTRLQQQQTDREDTRNTAQQRLGAIDATYDSLHTQRETLNRRLAVVLDQHATLADRISHLTQLAEQLETAAECTTALVRTTDDLRTATQRAEQAAQAAGFASPAEATDALLPDDDLARISEEITRWREQRLVLAARLDQPDLKNAVAQPRAGLEHAVAELEKATTAHSSATAAEIKATDRVDALAVLGAQLDAFTASLEPLEAAYRTVDHLHGLISGGSLSNQLRMQLESYVLAARLEEVVDAANTRLTRMSHHRFTLVHSDERAARGAKSGLGLKVLDAWNGHQRHTDTLSGGESFYVSLSLALGLADVVTAEAGGQALDTLFIDEGFGTLDDDTLHQVLDVLDSLRDHDRTVGVISHVAEMRRRITQRLHVRKSPVGSTLVHITEAAE
ncbi:SMC family ATPase [Streptomyces albogriseolus]|uniref:SMC family ATPase n=1 Tax=Streptomyces albogriseolus TaxID=1887 RepID=UPI0034603251